MSATASSRQSTRRTTQRPKRRVQNPRGARPTVLDQAVAALPISESTLRRITAWSIFSLVLAAALAVCIWFGLPQKAYVAAAEGIGRAGLRVDQVEITGLEHMDRMTVYANAFDQKSRAMPLVDLETVRDRLLRYGWVKDARVSRRLPDKLVVDIVERTPAAIWQNEGQLMLIDASGVLLEPVSPERMPDLPLVIGDGANAKEAQYRKLIDATPRLKPLVRAATWVGNRRWNLTFASGEVLELPQGAGPSTKALLRFADLDRRQGLLGKGYLRFDMRDPTKLVVRMPDEAMKTIDQMSAASEADRSEEVNGSNAD